MAASEENLALIVTPIFNMIGQVIQRSIKGGYYKISLFSVHDTTLVPMLLAWDVFDHRWPGFSAAITIELYEVRRRRNSGGFLLYHHNLTGENKERKRSFPHDNYH